MVSGKYTATYTVPYTVLYTSTILIYILRPYNGTMSMKNSEIQNYINDTKKHLKVLFDYHKHSTYIICEGYILSQLGTTRRFLPTHGRSDTVELHDGTIYYYINSTIHSTELSELLIAEPDYLFNLYLLLPDEVFSTLIYIQCECEYFNFGTNRFYSPFNIHEYLTNTIRILYETT